jgi:hypothetical protein
VRETVLLHCQLRQDAYLRVGMSVTMGLRGPQ